MFYHLRLKIDHPKKPLGLAVSIYIIFHFVNGNYILFNVKIDEKLDSKLTRNSMTGLQRIEWAVLLSQSVIVLMLSAISTILSV